MLLASGKLADLCSARALLMEGRGGGGTQRCSAALDHGSSDNGGTKGSYHVFLPPLVSSLVALSRQSVQLDADLTRAWLRTAKGYVKERRTSTTLMGGLLDVATPRIFLKSLAKAAAESCAMVADGCATFMQLLLQSRVGEYARAG